MIHPWLVRTWNRLLELGARLPHALLFVGPAGLGKRALADALAARLLCDTPAADGQACGHCAACQNSCRPTWLTPPMMRTPRSRNGGIAAA